MNSSTVCEQLRTEHAIIEHVRNALCVALRADFDVESAERWLERLCFLTDSFCRHLERLFRIEESDGYIGFLIDESAPSLSPKAERLLEEHPDLLQRLRDYFAVAQTTPADPSRLVGLRLSMLDYLDALDRHHRHEDELWMDAYLIDIGGEG